MKESQTRDLLLQTLSEKVLSWINANLGSVTTEDLTNVGIQNLIKDNEKDYQTALTDYKKVLGKDLTLEDIQHTIDAINKIKIAEKTPTLDSLQNALDAINKLEVGLLKDSLINRLKDATVVFIQQNPDKITVEVLEMSGMENVNPSLLEEYKTYLPEFYPLTQEKVQQVINAVNSVVESHKKVLANPTRVNLDDYIGIVGSLIGSTFKAIYEVEIPELTLLHLNFAPGEQDEVTYTLLGLTYVGVNMDAYNKYLPHYKVDITPEGITHEELQTFVEAVDAFELAFNEPTSLNVSQALEDIKKIQDGATKDLLLETILEKALSFLLGNLENVTTEDLTNVGIQDLIKDNEKEYQDALNEYQKDLGKDLMLDDIQKVIDAINKVIVAEKLPTPESLQDALDAIGKLEDGKLKDSLLERVKDAAVDHIQQNPDKLTEEILEMVGVKNVDPSLLEDYQNYLGDYHPLTQEKVQQVIDITNILQKALRDVTAEEINGFDDAVKELESSTLQTNLKTVSKAFHAFVAHETSSSDETLTALENAVDAVLSHDKAYIKSMGTSLDLSLTTALAPTDESVEEAVKTIGELREGLFKTRLLAKVGEAFQEFVQKNPGEITADDLIKAGYERVNPDLIEEYRKALVSLTTELGLLEREIIQTVIDLVNGLHDDATRKNLDKAQALKEEIEKFIASEWKTEILKEINQLISNLTPVAPPEPSNPPFGGGGNTKPESGKDIVIEGDKTGNEYEFVVPPNLVDKATDGKHNIVMKQADNIEITIPIGSIDYAALLKQLGKYGLLVQFVKIDEQNYKLIVKAVTPEGEKELRNFQKHLSVSVHEDSKVKAASIIETVVLRKDGNSLTAVPHQYKNNTFTIRTTQAGHFVVKTMQKSFKDIQNTFSRKEIEELANRHIVLGGMDNQFNPNRSITRAELASMIARAMDLQPTKKTSFKDINGKWYEDSVQAVYEAGIVSGKNNSTYAPDQAVTRQEAAAMMSRALKYTDSLTSDMLLENTASYKDAHKISAWAKEDVAVLRLLGIMNGKADGSFNPTSSLTRAEMAKILNGTLKYARFM